MAHLIRIAHDLYLTACYLLLLHTGYNLVDRIQATNTGYFLIPLWVLGAALVFSYTKETYDKEKQEANN
jgi:TRAP-type C4-dicarboxylate transport system permease small subunit